MIKIKLQLYFSSHRPASPKPGSAAASPKPGSAGPSPSVVPPRQQKPGAKSKPKKKKKGGW